MKRNVLNHAFAPFAIFLLFISCSHVSETQQNSKEKPIKELAYSNSVIKNFATVNIEGQVKFKMGIKDSQNASIKSSYKIGRNAVDRELWAHVYRWATTPSGDLDKKTYKFSSKANIGYVSANKNEPVTFVTYMDSIVWCNALTEYLNYIHKDEKSWRKLVPVYYEAKNEVREAFASFVATKEEHRRAEYEKLLAPYVLREAQEPEQSTNGMEFNEFYSFNGYRLPTTEEWEFASRLTKKPKASYDSSALVKIEGTSYYLRKGVCLSGSEYSYNEATHSGKKTNSMVSTSFGMLLQGLYNENPPQERSAKPNDIGCFDMSGGVWEWTLPEADRHIVLKKKNGTFVLDAAYPTNSNAIAGKNRIKGGSYCSTKAEEYAVGFVGSFPMDKNDRQKNKWQRKDIGFRIAKTTSNFF